MAANRPLVGKDIFCPVFHNVPPGLQRWPSMERRGCVVWCGSMIQLRAHWPYHDSCHFLLCLNDLLCYRTYFCILWLILVINFCLVWCHFAKFLFIFGSTYSFCGHCQQSEISALVCLQWPVWYIWSTWPNKCVYTSSGLYESIQFSLFLMVSFWEKLLHLCQLQRLYVNKYNKGLCVILVNGLLFHYCHLCVSAFLHMCLELYYRSECTNWINWNAVECVG